ncbi:DUF2141 domain-containing protein [Arsukibacterium perlucidum]|uniref:DUF2141 domain-containing protein n=1 Tax=Arsukibacterium perlucidum TaxID=368811 RepID=UPI0003605D71|nr:DUF2141 domain-containing protein [Arsukibacterium perlucidum]
MSQLNLKKSIVTAATAGMLLFGAMAPALADEVALTIKDIRKLQGHLLISMFKGEENYNNNTPYKLHKVKVTEAEHQVVFEEVEAGEYGIKVIHDENDNRKLDTNLLGMPKEGYGFSNNGGAYGPAPWSKAKFEVKDKTELAITLL